MDQIEKPLSILLIVAAIAYAFMYTDAGDGFTAIENNTASGYTIQTLEFSSTGYTVQSAELSEGYELGNIIGEEYDMLVPDTFLIDTLENGYYSYQFIMDTVVGYMPRFHGPAWWKGTSLDEIFGEKNDSSLESNVEEEIEELVKPTLETVVDSKNTEF